jgi:hypothetical protein
MTKFMVLGLEVYLGQSEGGLAVAPRTELRDRRVFETELKRDGVITLIPIRGAAADVRDG